MSNGAPVRRMGFASLFAEAKEAPTEIPTPARSPLRISENIYSKGKPNSANQTPRERSPIRVLHKPISSDKRREHGKPQSSRHKNFKCIKDPELDKTLPRGSKPILRYGEQDGERLLVADPRKTRDYAFKVLKGKKKYRPELQILQWDRDENSVGPDPPTGLLISGLSTITTSHEVVMQFRSFGEMSETKLQVDPSTGVSLGICRICYRKSRSNPKAASEAAQKAVAKMHGFKIGAQTIDVEFDDDGQLCERKVKDLLHARASTRESSGAKTTVVPTGPSLGNRQAVPTGPRTMQKSSTSERNDARSGHHRDERDQRVERAETKKYGRESTFRSRDISKISSGTSETNRRLAHYAYIFISAKVLPLHKVTAQELQLHFSGRKNKDIFTDNYGFYVLFDTDDLANHAFKTMDKSTFLGYRLFMELHKAKKMTSIMEEKPLGGAFKKTFQPVAITRDPVMETTNLLVKELQEVFMKDLRSRIAGPALLDFLNPSNFDQSHVSKKLQSIKEERANLDHVVHAAEQLSVRQQESEGKKLADVLSHIPRFKKKRLQSRKDASKRVSHRMDHHAMFSDASDASDNDSSDKHSDRPSSVAPSIDFEDEGNNTPLQRIKSKLSARKPFSKDQQKADTNAADSSLPTTSLQKVSDAANDQNDLESDTAPTARKHVIDFTSSSEDDEDEDEEAFEAKPVLQDFKDDETQAVITKDMQIDTPMPDLPTADKSKTSKKRGTAQKKGQKKDLTSVIPSASHVQELLEDDLSDMEEEGEEEDADDGAVREKDMPVSFEDDDVVLDIDGLQNLVKDEEDYELLQRLMLNQDAADIKDVHLWAWQQKDIKASHAEGSKGVTKVLSDSGYSRVNSTGSARTEGYYSIPDIEKSFYLPNRNRAVATEPGMNNSSSRMNRANNRRQAAGFEAQRQTLEAQTDLLRFNALKSRKKQLKFSRSAIHDWGLYALEHIERGDMVIEYVGEIIRQQVADHREKRYERQGIGSSYLFRIDDDTVIDATKSGNIARFINHSCDPSCTAKIITVYGMKKIVIYAQRDIGLGEEITYDYKFPLEDEKIPCLCGSPICRKFLN